MNVERDKNGRFKKALVGKLINGALYYKISSERKVYRFRGKVINDYALMEYHMFPVLVKKDKLRRASQDLIDSYLEED